MDTQYFCVEKEKRLDQILVERFPKYSRTYFQYLIANQGVTLNGKGVKKKTIPKKGDQVCLYFLCPKKPDLKAQDLPLDILYEDESIICINKRAGMVVHPAPGHPDGTVVNALLHHCQTLPLTSDEIRPGIVHRLDKDTSGILLIAKTLQAHSYLTTLFSKRKVKKEYLAICLGHPKDQRIEGPIGRDPRHRKEMTVLPKGKGALTEIHTLKTSPLFSLVRAVPVTGRTHQIRVHFKWIGFPILGDSTYGSHKINQKFHLTRQLLHAHAIHFPHPCEDKEISLRAPPPPDMQKWITQIDSP